MSSIFQKGKMYMEINALYETAKYLADILKQRYPYLNDDPDACLALIVADSGNVFSGVTSIAINEGNPETLPAEEIAAMSVVTAGETARQMMIISIDDNSFFEPSENALKILVNASPENGSCQVALSLEETAPSASLIPNAATATSTSPSRLLPRLNSRQRATLNPSQLPQSLSADSISTNQIPSPQQAAARQRSSPSTTSPLMLSSRA